MSARETVVPKGMEYFYERFHFAPAVRVGDVLHCSGQLGWPGPGQRVPEDPKAQFALAFENLRRVLEAGGASFADVFELTTFHVGLQQHLAVFTAVKDGFFREPWPAWTAIGITELAIPGALVELRAKAALAR
jgi:enamine deaminase RidA (YjgF/YER057c/UK114 family)